MGVLHTLSQGQSVRVCGRAAPGRESRRQLAPAIYRDAFLQGNAGMHCRLSIADFETYAVAAWL